MNPFTIQPVRSLQLSVTAHVLNWTKSVLHLSHTMEK